MSKINICSSKEEKMRSLLKAFSWRIMGTLVTIVLAFVLTKDISLSALVGVGELVSKTILFYIHERAWAHIELKTTAN
jgi:uncharacterized membrane protein